MKQIRETESRSLMFGVVIQTCVGKFYIRYLMSGLCNTIRLFISYVFTLTFKFVMFCPCICNIKILLKRPLIKRMNFKIWTRLKSCNMFIVGLTCKVVMCLSLNLSSTYRRTQLVFPTQPSPSKTTLKL